MREPDLLEEHDEDPGLDLVHGSREREGTVLHGRGGETSPSRLGANSLGVMQGEGRDDTIQGLEGFGGF